MVGSVRTSSPRAFFAHQLVGDGDDEASNVSCALLLGLLECESFVLLSSCGGVRRRKVVVG